MLFYFRLYKEVELPRLDGREYFSFITLVLFSVFSKNLVFDHRGDLRTPSKNANVLSKGNILSFKE